MDPHDDEAPKDPRVEKLKQSFGELDFEGHRAHSVFVGVHAPTDRRHSHRHKKHHKNSEGDKSASEEERPTTPPAQRVQFILGEDLGDDKHESHPLFSEMEELCVDGEDMEWKETARWIKFEEDVEEGGNRWSKPHVATLSLHSLFELRSLLLNGSVILDMEAASIEQIVDLVVDSMVSNNRLESSKEEIVKNALLKKHRHQHQRQKHGLPFIRSLHEIGKNHSTAKRQERALRLLKSSSNVSISRVNSGTDLMNDWPQHNLSFMRKIPPGAEASNILVGEVEFLDKPLSAFIRLNQAHILGDLTEVPVPTRFLFLLLVPTSSNLGYHEIGRAMATLMSDEVFHEVAYRAKKTSHLLAGVDEFLDAVTVLPPGEWDPAIRIEPPAAIPSQDVRKRPPEKVPEEVDEEEEEQKLREESGLSRTGYLFGGLRNDLKRKAPWYWSDFKDALSSQCIASWIFLYFACLSPIITFGGLLAEATGNNMAAMESLVSGFVSGMGYGFFSGQPLTILGSTGPVLVFESIVFDVCTKIGWDYLSFRFWIGTWIAVILLVLVAIDASALVCYITRFTEENFATLIALIFIYKVPHEFKPTLPNRGWVVHPFSHNPIYSILVALPPALLGTILIFMDQQITSVIINRKEYKLKKGCGYHLDLFVLSGLIQLCSVMGLPWFVAATVLSINHVNSLKLESECAAPGEKPQFLGVREQRVTHILIFLTIGLSVFLTPMLGHIPMPVLFGVFLYMGVASLKGLQFFDRILIMFMPSKYQPDYMFLRQVPIKKVHLFTIIQLTCLICLWVIKSFSATSILFPLMLVVMIGIRKSLDLIFTRRELKILDDVMPEMTKRHQMLKDQEVGICEKAIVTSSEFEVSDKNLKIPLANGKVMNIPFSVMNISEEVNKTGIWKQVNEHNAKTEVKNDEKKKSPKTPRAKKKKTSKKEAELKQALTKKLSIMNEEDEDEGITIKVNDVALYL
ncbi:hypothetical protein HUJ04_002919 [Dendroctonus ponderosae]|nr:hypothetical protein HUJ04_002919 [Dendroctonus ponderosae]